MDGMTEPQAIVSRAGVEVRGLCKRFTSRDGAVTVALDDISFDIREREFVSVVGPSGCG